MAVALYAYFDDANREYQVSLPDDFAVALSYQAPSVLAPYIPAEISPRYLSYWAPQTNQYRAVVCPNRTTWINPPQEMTIDGVLWSLSGFYGEKFQQLPGGNLVVISGVQGEKGEPGQDAVFTYATANMVGDVALNNTATDFSLITTALEAGTYLVAAYTTFQAGAAAARFDSWLQVGASTSPDMATSVDVAGASDFACAAIFGRVIVASANDLVLKGHCSVTSGFARATNGHSKVYATRLTWLKVA